MAAPAPSTPQSHTLTGPVGAPYSFSITLRTGEGQGHVFKVSGNDPQTGQPHLRTYEMGGREHLSYLDLFEQLAADFGLRLPQNRRPAPPPSAHRIPYREVLSRNLAPGMLYGYGDPAVIRVNENEGTTYYLVVTSNDAPDAFPILRSSNAEDWTFSGFVFPEGRTPQWAAVGSSISDYWAPEMHRVGDMFRLYFVARDRTTHELCIGKAEASHPEGPFIADREPLLRGNVIDPHLFVEDNGKAYLFWKEDNNEVWPGRLNDLMFAHPYLVSKLFDQKEDRITASFILALWPWARTLEPMERFQVQQVLIEAVISGYTAFYGGLAQLQHSQPQDVQASISTVMHYMKTPMFAQELTADGSRLKGEKVRIIENDLAWEAHLVEGMWVAREEARYYLFYAGNDFSTDQYGIGVAVSDHLLGPYSKMEAPFLRSTAEWWAPGHPSVVKGPDGTPQLFLHAYFPRQAGYKQFRALLSLPLQFERDRVLVKTV